MPANWMPTAADYLRFLPEIILTLAGTLLMVMDAMSERRGSPLYGNISIAALVAAILASVYAFSDPGPAFSDMLLVDGFATFFRILVIGVGILTVLSSYRYLTRENAEPGEYHALILFSVMGQCVMVTANELIMIFIGLEISSIATYILAGLSARRQAKQRSRVEVLPAGLVCDRIFPLRRRAHLWHDRDPPIFR